MTTRTGVRRGLAIFVVAALFYGQSLLGQDFTTYYTVMHPDKFEINWEAFYRKFEHMTMQTRELLPHDLNIVYGDDPKQRLDVYFPTTEPESAPVLVFLHGGGNREGDRLQYGYVAKLFAGHGIITVVASYRLQPAHAWPAQRDDAQAVLAWVYRNIGDMGGDPDRIFVSGHSAGSRLAAFLSYRANWLDQMSLPRDLIKGAALISGIPPVPSTEELPDAKMRAEANVLARVDNPPPRNLIVLGSLEAESAGLLLENSMKLADALRATEADVDFLVPEGYDHATIVLSLGDEESELFAAILGMISG